MVGAVLAVAFAVPTFWIARRRRKAPEIHALLERTAYRYLDGGHVPLGVRARQAPLRPGLLLPPPRRGVLPPEGRLLDLGCGSGILLALLLTAREQAGRGDLPADWPPPPRLDLHGIEGSRKIAEVARRALGEEAHIETADLRDAPSSRRPG